jgi:hypothetical protein
MKSRWLYVLLFLLGVVGAIVGVGCGGGGGSSDTTPATTGKPWPGNLIVSDTVSNEAYRVALGTGQQTKMPGPDRLPALQAYWAGYSGGKLLLLYQNFNAYFYDAVTLQKTATDFQIPNNSATMRGAKISRDGAYFAACWDGDGADSIGLFKVGGGYVAKLATPKGPGTCFRFDWLSDQRLVYDSGVDVVVTNGTSAQDIHYPYPQLPAGWKINGSQFAVDQAGQRILWAALQPKLNEASSVSLQVLVVASIDGTSPKQITDHPEAAKSGSTPAWHSNASWSPDGRFIAFNRVTENAAYYPLPGGGVEWVGGCTPVIFISADADKVMIDPYGAKVDESLLYTVPSTGKHLQTCAPLIWTE